LQTKKAVIPELREKRKHISARVAEAERAETLRERLEAVKGELGWAYVETKFKELEAKVKEVAKAERDLGKVKTSLESDQVGSFHHF
jgi:chromosome segregation ATPase